MQRLAGARLGTLSLLAIPTVTILVAARHVTSDFHKEIDWDMAFFIDLVRRGGATCCFHPLLDYPLAIYRALAVVTGDHLLSLQLFFLLLLLAGSVLYGLLFHLLFRSLPVSILAAATYPMFPLVQNLLSYFEDNLVKLPLLLGVLVLILAHRAEATPWRLHLGVGLFAFTCLVSLDALTWAPFVACLVVWRYLAVGTGRMSTLPGFCGKCLVVAITSFVLVAWSHDAAYPRSRRTTLAGLAGSVKTLASRATDPTNQPRRSQSPEPPRATDFFLEPLEPLFGLEHIARLAPRTRADATTMRRFLERLRERPGLADVTRVFLAVQVLLFGLAGWRAARSGDARQVGFIVIVFLNFTMLFAFNFAFRDRPNERYDHYVLQLPFILASYRGLFTRLRSRVPVEAFVLSFFIGIGLLHHARSPYRLSQLYRLQSEFPGHFAEYYLSIQELPDTKTAEAAFLAGYAPLRIVNVDGRRLNLFAPARVYIDRRRPAEIRNDLRARGASVYVSPGLQPYVQER